MFSNQDAISKVTRLLSIISNTQITCRHFKSHFNVSWNTYGIHLTVCLVDILLRIYSYFTWRREAWNQTHKEPECFTGADTDACGQIVLIMPSCVSAPKRDFLLYLKWIFNNLYMKKLYPWRHAKANISDIGLFIHLTLSIIVEKSSHYS